MSPDEEMRIRYREELKKVLSHVIRFAEPIRIILFGSVARGIIRPDSDIDLLIIKEGTYNPLSLSTAIYKDMEDVDVAVDLIFITPDQWDLEKVKPWSVMYPVSNQGKVVYEQYGVIT